MSDGGHQHLLFGPLLMCFAGSKAWVKAKKKLLERQSGLQRSLHWLHPCV